MYSENSKMLIKETEDNTNQQKDTLCSWIGRINIVEMTITPKAIYRLNDNPEIIKGIHRTRTKNPSICMKTQKDLE